MLASLLPGFRDVRSALVAGYMWFCAGWLLVGRFRSPSAGQLLSPPATDLLKLFGDGGRLVAISVLCLLIGEVTSSLVQTVFRWLSFAWLRRATSGERRSGRLLAVFRPLSHRAIRRVRARIRQDYERHQDETTSDATPRGIDDPAVDRLAAEALGEILFMSPRLIVAKPELHAEFGRIKAESEFRDALLLPLPVLAVAITLNLAAPPWLEAAALVAVGLADVYLFAQARKQFRQAHSLIGHSIADGTIGSAALSDLTPR